MHDIYGGYTTRPNLEKHLRKAKSTEKIQFISKCGIQAIEMARTTKIKHYDYSKKTHCMEC
jgi:predicted oxidoreductase